MTTYNFTALHDFVDFLKLDDVRLVVHQQQGTGGQYIAYVRIDGAVYILSIPVWPSSNGELYPLLFDCPLKAEYYVNSFLNS